MIIFGWKGITSTKTRGRFHCPDCDAPQGYAHRRVRRFFTLYFVPLIPLNLLGEYVECEKCRSTYRVDVLRHDPGAARSAAEAEFHGAMRLALLQIALADGEVADDELATIRQVCRDVSGKELPDGTLEGELAQLRRGTSDLESRLGQCAGYLNEHGKELVLRAALQVAAADGRIEVAELEQIAALAKALQMAPSHVKGVFAEALGDAAPRAGDPSRN